jgi:hypothetical protein
VCVMPCTLAGTNVWKMKNRLMATDRQWLCMI